MDTGVIVQQMLLFVLLMATGFVIRRLGILDADSNGTLTRLLLKVTLPAALIASLAGSTLDISRREVPLLFLFIALSFLIMGLLSWLAPRLFRAKRDERGPFMALGLFANVNFIGFPLIYAFFGPDGMFYAILYNIVFNLLVFSLGMKLVGGKQAKLSLKLFFSPVMVASMLSVLLFFTGIQLPFVAYRSLALLGGATTPLAMLLLGSMLGEMKVADMFRGWRIYVIAGVRLLFIPIVVYFLMAPLPMDTLLLRVILVMSAAPMAISIAMFTVHYNVHQELAGKGIFLSTVLSVLTIPLLLSFLL